MKRTEIFLLMKESHWKICPCSKAEQIDRIIAIFWNVVVIAPLLFLEQFGKKNNHVFDRLHFSTTAIMCNRFRLSLIVLNFLGERMHKVWGAFQQTASVPIWVAFCGWPCDSCRHRDRPAVWYLAFLVFKFHDGRPEQKNDDSLAVSFDGWRKQPRTFLFHWKNGQRNIFSIQ